MGVRQTLRFKYKTSKLAVALRRNPQCVADLVAERVIKDVGGVRTPFHHLSDIVFSQRSRSRSYQAPQMSMESSEAPRRFELSILREGQCNAPSKRKTHISNDPNRGIYNDGWYPTRPAHCRDIKRTLAAIGDYNGNCTISQRYSGKRTIWQETARQAERK